MTVASETRATKSKRTTSHITHTTNYKTLKKNGIQSFEDTCKNNCFNCFIYCK